LLVVVVGGGQTPGIIPPVAVVVVVVVVAATCRGTAVVVRVMVRMTICTQTQFPDPGQTQGYI